MIKRLLLAFATLLICPPLQAQYVTLAGHIQASNGAPAVGYTLTFQPSQMLTVPALGIVAPTATNCATSTGGSVVNVPDPTSPTTVTPQFTGTLPPSNYYVEYTFYTATGTETLPSPEIPAQLTSTGELTVASPSTGLPGNAAGMRVYIASTSGAETLQGSTTGTGVFLQSVPLVAGVAPPSVNTTVCQQIANDAAWPTGTGYRVTLLDPSGNIQPSYPMTWQLLGAGTTINLSSGLPYYNGVTIIPTPILAAPANHVGQSISSNLDHGGYNDTNIGTLTAGKVNSVVNASLQAGSDMGAKITAALTACAYQCTVYVPAGTWPFTTTISLPLRVFGTYKLSCDAGAILQYQGSGDAIVTPINTVPTSAELLIEGCQLLGNPNAVNGIHLYPGQHISIRNMNIVEFTNGNGILNEGANVVNIYDNHITNNLNGVHLISTSCSGTPPVTCSPTTTGAANSSNAVHVFANAITVNSHWGIFDEWNAVTGSTGSLGNIFRDNDLELNGFGGNTNYGAIFVMKSVGDVISGNYFEGSPHEVVLGQFTGGAGDFFGASGPIVRDNYFTTSPPIAPLTKSYNIELQNTIDALIEGNSEQGTGGISAATNCFINASTGGEQRTLISRNAIFQGGSTGNPICVNGTASVGLVGNGSGNLISPQYQAYMAFQNFPTTAVTSEVVPTQFTTAAGSCWPIPKNSSAVANWTSSYIANGAVSSSGATFTHPATAGMLFDIVCINNPNGGYGYP